MYRTTLCGELPCQWASWSGQREADTDARREVPGLAVDHVEALVTMGREPWVIISENVANIEKAEWTKLPVGSPSPLGLCQVSVC